MENNLLKNSNGVGDEMYDLMTDLFPICRSITGNGVRQSLKIIKKILPQLQEFEVPTGTQVFDWTIPNEWNITDAYIKNPNDEKIIDFKKSNLHVLNYSTPINKKISLEELKEHIFTLKEYPNVIPYKTSYYKENWGFCMTHDQFVELKEGEYEVYIDSSLKPGSLTYGEVFLPGKSEEEILFSTYICHPSMCNDNLSGIVLLTYLARIIEKQNRKYSYRFLFLPETIGAITWLSKNENNLNKIKSGLVATCVGDSGNFTYKKSREGNSYIDKICEKVLKENSKNYKIVDFFPSGSDERQFCSPGFNLPVGSLMKTMYTNFKEYHTSGDNLEFVKASELRKSLDMYCRIVEILENDHKMTNLNPKCEPQLGKRDLYSTIGASKNLDELQIAMLWILNLSDGKNSLLDIAIRSDLKFETILKCSTLLEEKGLLSEIKD